MFHKHTTKITAIAIGVALTAVPVTGFAADTATAHQPVSAQALKDMSYQDMRRETKAKISNTRAWAKDQTLPKDIKVLIHDMEQATDRLQDKVSPAGRSIKSYVSDSLPGKGLVHRSEKSLTFYGLLLMMAFAFVFLMMSLANPESRLGGRH